MDRLFRCRMGADAGTRRQPRFPETAGRWIELGYETGFGTVKELYVAPTYLFRLYRFGIERRED